MAIMEKALELVEERTKENPIKVLVGAIVNAAPREEIITIEYGGARYPKAVECAPQRRIDITIRFMTQGASQKSFGSKKNISECLADEIVAAYKMSNTSVAISKKFDSIIKFCDFFETSPKLMNEKSTTFSKKKA